MTSNHPMDCCRDISIYLGNVCNFNCSYCDRDYIKNEIGGQKMTTDDIDDIVDFLIYFKDTPNLEMLSFHGGEPFVYVDVMDQILERIYNHLPNDVKIFVQTNGSLILKNKQFIEKWKDHLIISISYDFLYQDINRTLFDIDQSLQLLADNKIQVQLQYVMPIHDRKVFGFSAIKAITDICNKHKNVTINLIPLRHIRGKEKFEVILDQINIPQFVSAFLKFIQTLYVHDINVYIDGHMDDIDKHYFNNHKQLVLSPDGNIYPEYDFLEYKMSATVIGRWKGQKHLNRVADENHLMYDQCASCPSKDSCGLKYLHKQFEIPVGKNCVDFYRFLDVVIKHNQKLKTKNNLLQWVGK